MKRFICLIVVCFMACIMWCSNAFAEFIYEDSDSGTKFVVPDNWSQEDFKEERYYIDAKFVSDKDNANTIIYGSIDAWDNIPDSDKKGFNRKDFNNSMFSKEDFVDIIDGTIQETSEKMLGGKKYYKYVSSSTVNLFGTDVDISMTSFVLADNGWIYTYQFAGEEKYYSDFESLIGSATYVSNPIDSVLNDISDANNSNSTNDVISDKQTNAGYDINLNSIIVNIIFSLIVTAIIYYIPIAIYRYGIKKEPISPKKGKIFTIIYMLVAFIIMNTLVYFLSGRAATGGGLLLWGFIGYRTLTNGYGYIFSKEDEYSDNNSREIYEQDDKKDDEFQIKPTVIMFQHKCTKCGNIFNAKYEHYSLQYQIPPLFVTCAKCGNKESVTDAEINSAKRM